MSWLLPKSVRIAVLLTFGLLSAQGGLESIALVEPSPAASTGFQLGQARRPDGTVLGVDSYSLWRNDQRWLPVMGEFHFSRYPENEWRGELLKMKAGGVDIVATYVFWIHHEEIEGTFDWSGQRSLRRFVELCREVGLLAFVRCGPWCHGEARNGGYPDWLQKKGWKLHSDDSNYLARVKTLYGEIGRQLNGLSWKDGGPVIGIQVENEYEGPAEHLLTLKRLAREAGIDVPYYTRTGWPETTTPMPFGSLLPVYGRYAEGFWERELTPMPAWYWAAFIFSHLRTDGAIATDLFGVRTAKDSPDAVRCPFLCCETGGGMASSYHRRILLAPADIESVAFVQLGSGSSMLGYYVYHGSVNPDGKLSTLQESQAAGDWNDLPVKSYDFQAPLRQYGQINPQYHSLRRLHLFLHDWGSGLAGMPMTLPERKPANRDDAQTLRWCVRSDGQSGFVFVNNYQRLLKMPAKPDVQFEFRLPSETLSFPNAPVTIPADSRFFWPFNLDLGHDVRLAWATAQPVCSIDEGSQRTVFFAQTKGVAAEFAFARDTKIQPASGRLSRHKDSAVVEDVPTGRTVAFKIAGRQGEVRIVLLDEADSLALWKGSWQGQERIFLTSAGLVLDGENLNLTSTNGSELAVGIYPAPSRVHSSGTLVRPARDGVFARFVPLASANVQAPVALEQIQPAGPLRAISIKQGVAVAPEDADFANAAVWKIHLPQNVRPDDDPLLRLNYVGDVARITLNGKLLIDDFYNGNPLEIGLRRHAPEILHGDLRIAILPLRQDAPIYLASSARPAFGDAASVVELRRAVLVSQSQVRLTP